MGLEERRLDDREGLRRAGEGQRRALGRLRSLFEIGAFDATAASSLWTDDGWYETDPAPLIGAQAIADMVNGPTHQEIIGGGSAHMLGPVAITIDGDSAVAIGYSLLVRHSPEGAFSVFRCSANRWELARVGQEWKVTSRRNALRNGSASARDLLRAGQQAS